MPIGNVDWIEEGTLRGPAKKYTHSITKKPWGLSFVFRNQFFHGSHPLGWINNFKAVVNGKDIPVADTFLVVREQWLPAWQIPQLRDIWTKCGEEMLVYVAGDFSELDTCEVGLDLLLSTFFFTPDIDIEGVYPTMNFAPRVQLQIEKAVESIEVPYEA